MAVAALPALPPDAQAALLRWYGEHRRTLTFRATRDPWAVLVSEVMAQQTQVARVEDAWRRFLLAYPTPTALAAATPAEVVRAWQGMGYDRRALNLRRAAIAIRDEHGGRVPDEVETLDALPGIGPYTARAVAAIAFGRPVGPLDTNVRRVLRRVLALAVEPVPGVFQAIADASVDPDRSGDWTHAMMDVGATLCRPRTTHCGACPLRPWCASAGLAPGTSSPFRTGRPVPRFETTSRWLRGRIVDRLRAAADGDWTRIDGPIGGHDASAVAAALAALARDGVVEQHPEDPGVARLAIG